MIDLGVVKVKLDKDPYRKGNVMAKIHATEDENDFTYDNLPESFSSLDASSALHGLKMRLKQNKYTGTIKVID